MAWLTTVVAVTLIAPAIAAFVSAGSSEGLIWNL